MTYERGVIRVRLIRVEDPYTNLKPRSLGTVMFVDDRGTTHVKWDSGSTLGLIPGHDQWEEVE
jgi:hypothetical protein